MEHLKPYLYITFAATILLAIWLFYKATNYSKLFLIGLLSYITIQSLLGISGFYSNSATSTARFPLLVIPPILFLLSRFFTQNGKAFLDGLDLPTLTIFHVIRIPVELILFWLFVKGAVPEAMTFHGRNFDILSGISAPFIFYFGFVKKRIGKSVLIVWNVICLALLLNVVSTALLSLPARFEIFGFEQPNIALSYFPFILLPACLVPLVVLSTFAALRKLLNKSFSL